MSDLLHEVGAGIARGWAFTPLDGKKPIRPGWQSEEPLGPATLRDAILRGHNIGLRTGSLSGVVVIDDDTAGDAGIELPTTVTVLTGSIAANGNRRQQFYYSIPRGMEIGNSAKVFDLPEGVDIRGDGGQVVYVGSVHPDTGNHYTWAKRRSPNEVPIAPLPDWLIERAKLHNQPPPPPPAVGMTAASVEVVASSDKRTAAWANSALAKEVNAVASAPEGRRNIQLNESAFNLGQLLAHLDRSTVENALIRAASQCRLPAEESLKTIRSGMRAGEAKPRQQPPERPQTDSPAPPPPKSSAPLPPVPASPEEPVRLGLGCGEEVLIAERDPESGKRILSTKKPMEAARAFQVDRYARESISTLLHWGDRFYRWDGSAYTPLGDKTLRTEMYLFAEQSLRWLVEQKNEPPTLHPFSPTKASITNFIDALEAVVHLSSEAVKPPAWLADSYPVKPYEICACRNGLLHIPTRTLYKPTPEFFTTAAVAFDYKAAAPKPTNWLQFLHELWGDDPESIACLQEWFGYFLTPDTRQQKILTLIGPRRSGKGTIARVLQQLLGPENVCSPTLDGLSQNFGLYPLIGRSLAIIADARLGGRADQSKVVERLLNISGEDAITVDRKHKDPVTVRFPTRIIIASNELPTLSDSSSALSGRFIALRMQKSFYGREDTELTQRLMAELPGILLWALEGWDRLHEQGRFFQPLSGQEIIDSFEEVASPARTFVRDCCELGTDLRVQVDELFDAFRKWSDDQGAKHVPTASVFGRQLRAAYPSVTKHRNPQTGAFYGGIRLSDAWIMGERAE